MSIRSAYSQYVANGFKNREDYLNYLKQLYNPYKVDILSDMLGESEDFDGLVTMLEDDFEFDDDFGFEDE